MHKTSCVLCYLMIFIVLKMNSQSDTLNFETNPQIFEFKKESCLHNLFLNPEVMGDSLFSDTVSIVCEIPFYAINDVDFGQNPIQNGKDFFKLNVKIIYEKGIKVKIDGFYESGERYCEIFMNKNGRHGSDRRWYDNQQLLVFTIFENGKAISPTISWYYDGKVRHFHEENSSKKLSMKWYKNGELAQVAEKTDSNNESIIIKDYYKTGELSTEGNYNNGKQIYKMFWKNGVLGKKGYMLNLPLQKLGKWEEWYESGQIKLESYYHDSIPNLKVNTWKYYSEKGILIKEEHYENGDLIKTKEHFSIIKKE